MGSTGKPDPAPAGAADDDEEAFLSVLELCCMADMPQVLRATMQLGLLQVISEGGGRPMSAAEIVTHIPARNPGAAATVDRMLSLLASYNIVTCSPRDHPCGKAERFYGLSPACKFLIENEDGVSLAPLVYMQRENAFVRSWYS